MGETKMNSLIEIENNKKHGLVVSSRVIADRLGKEHSKVIRTIEDLLLEKPNLASLIIPAFYAVEGQKRKYKEYLLTKDGFTLYMFNIQGYNDFKMAYINRFNEMEAELKGNPKKLPSKEKLSSINNAARTILPVMEKAGMKPEYQFYLLRQLYDKAGVELPMERFEQESKLYDKTAIAKILGVMSQNGNPHAQAIGAILTKVSVEDEEKELTSFERNGHTGVEYQYKESVIGKVSDWLMDSNYPLMISAKGKNYKVNYSLLSEVH